MRVVVVGATGNVGAALLSALAEDPAIEAIVGVARRRPSLELHKVQWRGADVVDADLVAMFRGADAVVHLAWLIQPSRDEAITQRANVDGSRRVFEAVAVARVPKLVYASSVGAYSPGPKDQPVAEDWPTGGVASSFYSRHKAAVEHVLDSFEADHPEVRVVRLRPGLIFGRRAATGIRRLFLGPFFPGALLRPPLIFAVPRLARLRFQAVHRDDVAEAFRLAVRGEARGVFNLAAAPVLDSEMLARLLDARPISLRPAMLRRAAALSWRLRLQPSSPGWIDMALAVPIMDTSRADRELGWRPRRTSIEALTALLAGLREGAGYPTPPLDPATSGPLRLGELRSGVGAASI